MSKGLEPDRNIAMKPDQVTETLEQAAAQVGVRVRYESMTGDSAGAGGLCRIRGEWTIIIDRKATASDRAGFLSEALAGFDLDAIYLPPEIRQMLARRRAAAPAPTAAPPTEATEATRTATTTSASPPPTDLTTAHVTMAAGETAPSESATHLSPKEVDPSP